MHRQRVDSTAIASLGYDPRSQTLEVEFTSGDVYDYFGVTGRLWSSFLKASSKGQFFIHRVRDRFPFEHRDS